MHLKKVVKIGNKFFIRHFVIIDAIDGSEIYYEELKGIKKGDVMSDFWRGVLYVIGIGILGYFGMLFYFMSI